MAVMEGTADTVSTEQLLAACVLVAALVGAGAAVAKAARWGWQFLRSVARLADDLTGEPARGTQPARLGLLQRLDKIESRLARLDDFDARLAGLEARLTSVEGQLKPNGGGSLRDAVDRIAVSTVPEEAAA